MSWRPSLRIAARDARRAKARSALIVAMIALPVLALSFADVMWRTAVADPGEQLARDLGQADASLVIVAGPGNGLIQAADPRPWKFMTTGDGTGVPADIHDLTLPAGLRLLVEEQRDVAMTTAGGRASLGWTEVDAADPALSGRWRLQDGRYPTSAAEVLLTPATMTRTGLTLGDTLRTLDPDRTFTVVGEVAREGERGALTAVALPGTLIGAPGGLPEDAPYAQSATGFLVGGPVSWTDVQRLNDQGAVVTSRAVLADPPATTAYDEAMRVGNAFTSNYLVPALILAMVLGLSGLIIVLLAGTAFAVGARRQSRSLALVAAAGGSRRDLRRTVLGGGLVLGAAAGVLGVLLGVAAAAVLVQLIWRRQWLLDTSLASFDLRPLELLAIAGIGVVTGVLAAVVPARQAARLDVVAALRGRSGQASRSRRTPVVGLLMIVVGVVLSVLGSGWVVAASRNGSVTAQNLVIMVLVGGAGLVLLGLVFCSGWVVSLVSRLAPRLPLAGRLALRDAHRHRSRTAPAVAAVLAAVSGSVAVMLYVAALDQSDRERYTPGSPPGTATVNLVTYDDDPKTGEQTTSYVEPDRVVAALGTTLPVAEAIPIVQPVCGSADCSIPVDWSRPEANQCSWPAGDISEEQAQQLAESDPRCADPTTVDFSAVGGDSSAAVGGPELLTLTGGTPSAAAVKALESGGMVVVDRLSLDEHGRVAVQAFVGGKMKTVLVPAVAVPVEDMTFNAVMSPALVKSLGVKTAATRLLLRLDGPVSTQKEDAARAALEDTLGSGLSIQVERGYQDNYALGLLALAAAAAVITLGATGIATGLSLTDARADHATLGAVGAPPRLRRRLAAAQAVTVGGIGVVLGVAAGAVPALSIIGAVDSLRVVWPWPQLVVLVVGIPLLAGGFAYVFTRSRVPMQRRVVA